MQQFDGWPSEDGEGGSRRRASSKFDPIGEAHIHPLIIVVAQKESMWPQNASINGVSRACSDGQPVPVTYANGKEIIRDIVERPESVFMLPSGSKE
jgi:hypothetical protein